MDKIRLELEELQERIDNLLSVLEEEVEEEKSEPKERRKWPDSRTHQFVLEHQGCYQGAMIEEWDAPIIEEWDAPQPSSVNNSIIRLVKKGLIVRDKSTVPYRLYAATESEVEVRNGR